MKVLILVLSADFEPYTILTNGIKSTWASYTLPGIEIFFYYGKSDKNNTSNDIYLNSIECSENVGRKTLEMFEYIKDMDFDYIFRTNSSSYVNQEKLLEFLIDKEKINFYCGIIGICSNTRSNFASGCGYFLSKDLIKLVLDNKSQWNHNINDDVALSKLLQSLNVSISDKAIRLDILSTNIDSLDIYNMYHFRCKQNNRNDDVLIMKKLHNELKNN